MNKKKIAVFFSLFIFQFLFGLYYDSVEHGKGRYFDPLISSQDYADRVKKDSEEFFSSGDIEAYHRAAYSIYKKGSIQLANGEPSAWVTPGYPWVLSLIFKVFGFHFVAVVLFNALFLTGSIFILFKTAELLFSERVAWFTLLLLSLNLRMSMFVGYVYTECLFVFCMALAFYRFIHLVETGKSQARVPLWDWVITGLICGFAVLVRPVFISALLVFLIYQLIQWRRQLLIIALFGCVFLSVPSLWLLRNYHAFGEPVMSTGSSLALVEGNFDFYKSYGFWDLHRNANNKSPFSKVRPGPESVNAEFVWYKEMLGQFNEWVANNRSFYYWLCIWRFKTFLSPYTADMSRQNQVISLVLWLITFPSAFLGLFMARKKPAAWLIAMTATAFLVVPSIVIVGPSLRYQIPSQLLLSLLSAFFYCEAFLGLSEKVKSAFWKKSAGSRGVF